MKQRIVIGALLLVALVLAGCGRSGQEMAGSDAAYAPELAMEEAEPYYQEGAEGIGFKDDVSRNETVLVQNGGQERIIIRTADMSIVVADTEGAMERISGMAVENGGWVVESSVYQYDEEAMTGNMSVRVPASGFDSFLEAVRQLSVKVNRVSTSGQDVTEEYVDLSARLESMEATADRVRSFLDEAETVEEALEVSRELGQLEADIEAMKGRMQYLDQSAAYSFVSIDLTPDVLSQPIEVGGWQPQGVVRSALETLIATLQTLVEIAIWFALYVLPVVLIIAIPAWLIIRFIRRRRAARQVPHEEGAGNNKTDSPAEAE